VDLGRRVVVRRGARALELLDLTPQRSVFPSHALELIAGFVVIARAVVGLVGGDALRFSRANRTLDVAADGARELQADAGDDRLSKRFANLKERAPDHWRQGHG
jgi:hypothetical protein